MSNLQTPDDVIEFLNGNQAVGQLCGRSAKTVSNWRHQRRTLPPSTYLVLQQALRERGVEAPAHIWGMITASDEAS